MKLLYSRTSPFARKVRMVILEKGLSEQIQMSENSPLDDPEELLKVNPLGKIPALVTDDGSTLVDSTLICAFLDQIAGGNSFYPSGASYWPTMTAEATANGVMEAAFHLVMEANRPDAEQSAMWVARWHRAISRALGVFEAALASDDPTYAGELNIAQIALATALGYLDFRLSDSIKWRHAHPKLAAWHQVYAQRPAYQATLPPV